MKSTSKWNQTLDHNKISKELKKQELFTNPKKTCNNFSQSIFKNKNKNEKRTSLKKSLKNFNLKSS